jgi:DNA-binding MarR family transcriptional regulator
MAPLSPETQAARLIQAFLKFGRTPWHNAPASGLSQVETDILENINRAARHGNEPRVSDISSILRVSSPTVTQHLNNLEDQGFILRTHSKDDKRSVRISLTEKGTGALKSHWILLEKDFNEFIDFIGTESAGQMIDLLMSSREFFTKKAMLRESENLLKQDVIT